MKVFRNKPLPDNLNLLRSWVERHFVFKCVALFLLLSLVKSRSFIPLGRFWAEEAAIFYVNICTAPGWNGLGFLFNNHLEFWTNLGVMLATRVPLETAPAVTTYYALALQALPLGLIAATRQHLGLSRAAVLAIIVVAIGMPQSREIWANTINLHFHFAILTALVLALPATGRRWAWGSCLILIACGLSGIPANFLAPLFVLVALQEKTPLRWLQALLLTGTALLQVWLLLSSGYDSGRAMIPRPDIIVLSGLTHSFFALIWSPVAGRLSSEMLVPLVQSGSPSRILAGLIFTAAAVWLVVRIFGPKETFHPNQPDGRRNLKLLLSMAVLLSASVTLAVGDRTNLVSSHYGGRYFFAPNILVAILLLSKVTSRRRLRTLATISLVVFSLAGVLRFYGGPEWSRALAEAQRNPRSPEAGLTVDIWPQGWRMEVPAACLPDQTGQVFRSKAGAERYWSGA